MGSERLSDAELRRILKGWWDGDCIEPMARDLLQARRALRRIQRLARSGGEWRATIWEECEIALGRKKGGKRG